MRRSCHCLFAVLVTLVAVALIAAPALAAPKKTKMDTPVISCGTESTNSIDILVCAPSGTGATGLPAGFSVQWETAADFATFGWPADSSCPLDVNGNPTCGDSFCKASFSGNAFASTYNLSAGTCITVRIGDLLLDNGASVGEGCGQALQCGTEYVFRSFGHATSKLNRSDLTATLTCSTQPCQEQGGCTLTQGFWKTHGPIPVGNNSNEWPVPSLTLGNVSYSDALLLDILNTPTGGNGAIALAHQLIAAKLNVANGADDSAIAATITAADALLVSLCSGNPVPSSIDTDNDPHTPKVNTTGGTCNITSGTTSALVLALDNYNTGLTGPGHCDGAE
jgi:hypothetical protein